MLTTDNVTTLAFVGQKQAQKLKKLGISTVEELLYHIPKYYKDTSSVKTISSLTREDSHTVIARIKKLKNIRIRSGKFIQKAICYDESGEIAITWFNQPYLTKNLKVRDLVYLSGKLNPKTTKPEMISPEYEIVKEKNLHLGRIVPVYTLTRGVSIRWLRARLDSLTEDILDFKDLTDNLSEEIKKKFVLLDLHDSLRKIHFPNNKTDIIESRKRLAFDELLEIYFKLLQEREKRVHSTSPLIKIDNNKLNKFIQKLSFQLTKSQLLAISDIFNDYKKTFPMHRLLQGDVGSGKTIVALIAALPVMESGLQTIILTPTSVLAQQHFSTITKFLNRKLKIILQTSSSKNSKKDIESSDIIISTHSILYQENELLKRLGLLIIDEEHRFGVDQRKQLIDYFKGPKRPHLLSLTATPIPRSVALSLFGQMDVSIIEKPEARIPVKTFVVPSSKKDDSISWLKQKLKDGGQIFWICPLIDESDSDNPMMSVEKTYSEVKGLFKEFNVEFLHGKIKSNEKDRILTDFKNSKIQILVSTTVIEVGIDMPNANIMIIENAEMFGLAQLHQLRGRVGRNNQEAWCLLYTKLENNENVMARLKYFEVEKNGIKIAEYDLSQRGPGEVYGTIQAGIPNLKVANFSNLELMDITRRAAEIIYQSRLR